MFIAQFAAVHYFTKYDSGEEIPFPETESEDEETVSVRLSFPLITYDITMCAFRRSSCEVYNQVRTETRQSSITQLEDAECARHCRA